MLFDNSQKALFLPTEGGALELGARAIPKPGPKDLLVKIEATALNPIDWVLQDFASAVHRIKMFYPFVLGFDSAGVVEEIGEEVKDFKKGDKV